MNVDTEVRSARAAAADGLKKVAKDEAVAHLLRQLYLTAESYFQEMPLPEETALGESARIVTTEGEFEGMVGFEAWLHEQMLFNDSGISHLRELGFDGQAIVELAMPLVREWLYALPDIIMPPEAAGKLQLEYVRTEDGNEVVQFVLEGIPK